jgi:hypothetical protein
MTTASREKEAHMLMLQLQAETDAILDQYVAACGHRTPGSEPVTSPDVEVLQQQLHCHRQKADEAALLMQQLSDLRSHLQVIHPMLISPSSVPDVQSNDVRTHLY